MRVAGVVGAGLMGADVALLFANAGFNVVLRDIRKDVLERARERNRMAVAELRETGILRDEKAFERITYTLELKDLSDVDFVFEAITENLEAKRNIFSQLENLISRDTVMATNTSSFTVSEIAEALNFPKRLGAMHFSNPPIFMKLIEIVAGSKTSEGTLNVLVDLAKQIGKTPVLIKNECRGFVLNRLLMAAMADALWCLKHGIKPEDIDVSVKNLGMPFGAVEGMDLIGLDTVYSVLKSLEEAYGARFAFPEEILGKLIHEGKLGKKTGKGFYVWREGKAEVPRGKPYDITRMVAVVVNEASRIIEEGVANKETIGKIYKLALNIPLGIFDIGKFFGFNKLFKVLEEAYNKFKLELYKPTKLLTEMEK